MTMPAETEGRTGAPPWDAAVRWPMVEARDGEQAPEEVDGGIRGPRCVLPCEASCGGGGGWDRRRWMGRGLFATLAGSLALPATAEAARFSTVVIDPGHGGSDNGAKWGGVAEKVLTLDLARQLSAVLKAKGVRTVLTRTSDTFVSLDARAAKANRYSSAVFVSVHFNAHLNRSIRGLETFYMSAKGRTLAALVQKRMMSRVRSVNRGIKQVRGFAVLRKTRCPAILVECGFLSNSWERQRCAAAWYRKIVAQLIAEGIMQYR